MVTRSLLEQLTEFDTALLANTIGYIDSTPPEQWYMGGMIQSQTPALGPTIGVAAICEVDSSTPGGEPDMDAYGRQLAAFDRSELPIVWVVKAVGSRPDHECVLGDGMAKVLTSVGCVGIVTNGGVRDVDGLLTTSFAAYARGTVIHHGTMRMREATEPIEVGGITVAAGDVIHAGKEGVIKIPATCLEQLPERAAAMVAYEHEHHTCLRRTDLDWETKMRMAVERQRKYGFVQ